MVLGVREFSPVDWAGLIASEADPLAHHVDFLLDSMDRANARWKAGGDVAAAGNTIFESLPVLGTEDVLALTQSADALRATHDFGVSKGHSVLVVLGIVRLDLACRMLRDADDDGSEHAHLEQLYPARRRMDEHEQFRFSFQALGAGRHDLVTGVLGRDRGKTFDPGATFGSHTAAFLRHLARAMKEARPSSDVEPAWREFLAAFPRLHAARTLELGDFVNASRAVFVQLGGLPLTRLPAAMAEAIESAPRAGAPDVYVRPDWPRLLAAKPEFEEHVAGLTARTGGISPTATSGVGESTQTGNHVMDALPVLGTGGVRPLIDALHSLHTRANVDVRRADHPPAVLGLTNLALARRMLGLDCDDDEQASLERLHRTREKMGMDGRLRFTFHALGAGRPDLMGDLRLPPVLGVDRFPRRLARAMRESRPAADLEPDWQAFLHEFPRGYACGTLMLRDLVHAGRAVFVQLGGLPLAELPAVIAEAISAPGTPPGH